MPPRSVHVGPVGAVHREAERPVQRERAGVVGRDRRASRRRPAAVNRVQPGDRQARVRARCLALGGRRRSRRSHPAAGSGGRAACMLQPVEAGEARRCRPRAGTETGRTRLGHAVARGSSRSSRPVRGARRTARLFTASHVGVVTARLERPNLDSRRPAVRPSEGKRRAHLEERAASACEAGSRERRVVGVGSAEEPARRASRRRGRRRGRRGLESVLERVGRRGRREGGRCPRSTQRHRCRRARDVHVDALLHEEARGVGAGCARSATRRRRARHDRRAAPRPRRGGDRVTASANSEGSTRVSASVVTG